MASHYKNINSRELVESIRRCDNVLYAPRWMQNRKLTGEDRSELFQAISGMLSFLEEMVLTGEVDLEVFLEIDRTEFYQYGKRELEWRQGGGQVAVENQIVTDNLRK